MYILIWKQRILLPAAMQIVDINLTSLLLSLAWCHHCSQLHTGKHTNTLNLNLKIKKHYNVNCNSIYWDFWKTFSKYRKLNLKNQYIKILDRKLFNLVQVPSSYMLWSLDCICFANLTANIDSSYVKLKAGVEDN